MADRESHLTCQTILPAAGSKPAALQNHLASPANFAATNPEAIQQGIESKGSPVTGLNHLLGDLKQSCISITDKRAFEMGESVTVSEAAVVFKNDLFQSIQYLPLTTTVAQRPMVVVPPCINEFYILDLQPENSFVRLACEQGRYAPCFGQDCARIPRTR